MTLRKMKLPEGWYPHNPKQVELFIDNFKSVKQQNNSFPIAGIVPHAGWYFSGKQAWEVICQIPAGIETVIVAGGHLSERRQSLCWNQDIIETPHGPLKLDRKLYQKFCQNFKIDNSSDNTIEILLPFLSFLNPDMKILPVRLPPEKEAYQWGRDVGIFCREINKKVFFLGSTDLTHYGPSYNNLIYKEKPDAVKAAREQDRKLLQAFCNAEVSKALNTVEKWHCACSAGGALGAVGFASSYDRIPGEILSLSGSYDKVDNSLDFVNYGTVIF